MDRSKLADLSEIVSSIAIVITLIFLTVEVRQNTNALHAQSRQSVLEAAQVESWAGSAANSVAWASVCRAGNNYGRRLRYSGRPTSSLVRWAGFPRTGATLCQWFYLHWIGCEHSARRSQLGENSEYGGQVICERGMRGLTAGYSSAAIG